MAKSATHNCVLPQMGEGIEGGDVVTMLVAVGDLLGEGQTICELETSKALIEVPADAAGKVESVKFKEGDTIKVGETIVVLSGVSSQVDSTPQAPAEPQHVSPQAKPVSSSTPRVPTRPPSKPAQPRIEPVTRPDGVVAPAGPATRRQARELGVELAQVPGSGPEGRITGEDVKAFVRSGISGGVAASEPELPDFSVFGPVERIRPGKVKQLTAKHMSRSWSAIPHVTQFETADITSLEHLRRKLDLEARESGGRLTLTVVVMKALVPALRKFPMFNASRDPRTGDLVYKYYYNIGIATATERGLLVPVIRAVDRKNMLELSHELNAMAQRAREGKTQLDELQGGTFSISNQGGIGGSHFTPIVNHPEAAILAIGRNRIEPGYAPGEPPVVISPRTLLPLALSYDHRIIDGAEAGGFIRLLKESLEDPGRLLLGL